MTRLLQRFESQDYVPFNKDGRELQSLLGSTQKHVDWAKYQIEKFGFIEGIDFILSVGKSKGGRPPRIYLLTEAAAHRIANHSEVRSETAMMVKDNSTVAALAIQGNEDAILLQAQMILQKRCDSLLIENKRLLESEAASRPKLEYVDKVLDSNSFHNITSIAKELNLRSGSQLNQILKEKGVQYKQSGIWHLYAKYANRGYTVTKTHLYEKEDGMYTSLSTKWTEKGRRFIHELCNPKLELYQ